jgi:hypothetical protein
MSSTSLKSSNEMPVTSAALGALWPALPGGRKGAAPIRKSNSILPVILGLAATLCAFGAKAETREPTAESQSFLFIGNSFTARHELKDIFKTLATEGNPGTDFITERITYGGRDLFRHFELFRSQDLLRLQTVSDADIKTSMSEMEALAKADEPAFYTEYWKKIDFSALQPWEEYEAADVAPKRARANAAKRGSSQWKGDRSVVLKSALRNHRAWLAQRNDFPPSWDYVVLQSWQDMNPDPESGYVKYASKFIEFAKQQNTQPILYITAPYSQNMAPVTGPVEKDRALMEVRLAADLAKKTSALVVPVPLAIYRLQKAGTSLALRYKNDGHPNQYCAYLTACLFYAAVFNKSPEGLALTEVVETKVVDPDNPGCDPDGNPLKRTFTESERQLLQRTAWETMEAFRRGEF